MNNTRNEDKCPTFRMRNLLIKLCDIKRKLNFSHDLTIFHINFVQQMPIMRKNRNIHRIASNEYENTL